MKRGQKEERLPQTDNPFMDPEFNKPSDLGDVGAMLDDIAARLDLLVGKDSPFVLMKSDERLDGARVLAEGIGVNISDGGAGEKVKIKLEWPHPLILGSK